jgi:nicotinamidase-related amidase
MALEALPIPPHFDPRTVGAVWRVPYQQRAADARAWARRFDLAPAAADQPRTALLLVDVQNTFCIPEFELFVGGPSGTGAVDDNRRICEFIYRHLHRITAILPTMDTHQTVQIFHTVFLVDEQGAHPAPFTVVRQADIDAGRWRFNPAVAPSLGIDAAAGQALLEHYTRQLASQGKYDLTIWPFHAMLGGIGHAMVSAVEEAVFFHGIARSTQAAFQLKGNRPLTEYYSALAPEVTRGPGGETLAQPNDDLIRQLLDFDHVLVAGQAKSHCVAWTVADLLAAAGRLDPSLAQKICLLDDASSPVVIPGVVDYSTAAEAAYQKFADAGVRRFHTTDPPARWPGSWR